MPKRDIKTEYINALKDAGKVLIEQSEHLVNDIDTNNISNFTIWLTFEYGEIPTMTINKDYALKMFNKED